jgi:Ca2+-dependent lipid-binding protein
VVEGKNLKNVEGFTKQDPYVKLILDGQIAKSKTHNDAGKNPTWNQNLALYLII